MVRRNLLCLLLALGGHALTACETRILDVSGSADGIGKGETCDPDDEQDDDDRDARCDKGLECRETPDDEDSYTCQPAGK